MAQILNETLRWAIVAPYAARVHDADIVIDGHCIPAGVRFCLQLPCDPELVCVLTTSRNILQFEIF